MQLQGRNLEKGHTGADVSLLHFELNLIGYPPPEGEILNNTFGPGTQQVVQAFQSKHGLKATGIVDAATAKAINAKVAEQVSIDVVLARLGEEIARYQAQIDQLRQGNPDLALEVERLRTALQAMQTECDRVKNDAAASAGQVAALEQALATAKARIAELEALLKQPNGGQTDGFVVHGHVRNPEGKGVSGLLVRAYDQYLGEVQPLGEVLVEADGRYEIPYSIEPLLVKGKQQVDLVVRALSLDRRPLTTSLTRYQAKPVEIIDLTVEIKDDGQVAKAHIVSGQILLDTGLPAAKLTVGVFARSFGCTSVDPLNETTTDDQGHYTLTYAFDNKPVGIEVRAKNTEGKWEALSRVKYQPGPSVTLNLVAPAKLSPPTPEYTLLMADLASHVGQAGKLGDAREDEQCQDLTWLHQASGWDARLIALAATADRLGGSTGMAPDVLYGLFRVGLPTDSQALALVSAETFDKALDKAQTAGIVALNEGQVAQARKAFKTFAQTIRPSVKAPGALSSVGDLLDVSGLSEAERIQFEDLLFGYQGEPAGLWDVAKQQGLAQETITSLRVQGKLAYLTLDNVPLTAALQAEIGAWDKQVNPADGQGSPDLSGLVSLDLYEPEAWKNRIQALSQKKQKLDTLIPPAYTGETVDERLAAYANDLARQVRQSFPTHVVGRLIEKDAVSLGAGHEALKTPVQAFLQKATTLGFELGRVPIDTFAREHGAQLFADPNADDAKAVVDSVKQVQRQYQITPSDAALQTLSRLGFTGAGDVTAYAEDQFLTYFGHQFGSVEEARMVHRQSQQVSSVTYSFAGMVRHLDSAPQMHVMSPPAAHREAARQNLIRQFPSLESLFGSLDFCECEHCRSVLSPAAYLVDLLEFLNPKNDVWLNMMRDWERKHQGAPYPFNDRTEERFAGARPPGTRKKPYDVLAERRPDLAHLPLTCENTQTALPYIDIVNEILEYYVAHNQLAGEAAHDTGDATTPELLAEPQHIEPAAYNTLQQARYPLGLPFDLWLETVRRFFEHFETPLWRVLDTFRQTDELLPPASPPPPAAPTIPYGRADIFREFFGLSAAESWLFTDLPAAQWYTLYGYETEGEAFNALASAKTLSRRLRVTYQELIDLVQTGFVNPRLAQVAIVWKLGVDISDVVDYFNRRGQPAYAVERAAFEARLAALDLTAQRHLEALWNDGAFRDVLVLRDTSGGCNFDAIHLVFAGPAVATEARPADALALRRLNLFVRLWKKLGWTMAETERALQVFLPRNLLPLTDANLGTALKTALLCLAHLKALDEQLNLGQDSHLKLLTFWSDIDTTGARSLYAGLFLTRSILKNDPVFDHPLGKYLQYLDAADGQYKPFRWAAGQTEDVATGYVPLKSHLLAVQGALNLTEGDIRLILEYNSRELNTEPLTLAGISLLYRYGVLARVLRLSVRDLITLKALSGLDPFHALSPDPVTTLATDFPFTHTLRFVETVQRLKDGPLSVEDMDYLLHHHFDPVGKYRPNPAAILALVKTLAAEIRRIRDEHAVPSDPLALTDDILRQKLALVLLPDVVDKFMGLWSGTVQYTVVEERVVDANKLNARTFAGEPAVQVTHDATREQQRLTYRGVLLESEKTRLVALLPEGSAARALLTRLLDRVSQAVQRDARAFFQRYFVKATVGEEPTGFLEVVHFEPLFTLLRPIPGGLAPDEEARRQRANLTIQRTKRRLMAEAFLPYLQRQLIQRLIVDSLATSLNTDRTLTEALVTDSRLLDDEWLRSNPAAPVMPLLEIFTAVGQAGVSAAYFTVDNASGTPVKTAVVPTVDTALREEGARVKPEGTSSARFEGYLEVPSAGPYRFLVALPQNAEAELRFDHLPDPLIRAVADRPGAELHEFIELKPGVLYRFSLEVRKLASGDARLLVQGESLPKDALGQLPIYPLSLVEQAGRAHTLLAKTLQLIQALGLTEREMRYLFTHGADFANLDLSQLPTRNAPQELEKIANRIRDLDPRLTEVEARRQAGIAFPQLATEADGVTSAVALFAQVQALLDYAELKRGLAGETDDLIGIFERTRRTFLSDVPANQAQVAVERDLHKRLAELIRRDSATVTATADKLGYRAESQVRDGHRQVEALKFARVEGMRRFWEALQVVQKVGIPVEKLVNATTIVIHPTTDAERTARTSIARDLRNTVKARYEPAPWQRIAQPIFDKLRQRQRDALVAYIVHHLGFQRPEQLFEYFLIDPGMEPVVQTSRVRLAISSVQLFIQRCLLNLEPGVHPSAINSQHWQWMKRYRVWEANRKIFLYPENWMEPEFRDDKTHLFQRLESSLLQGDVSNDLAEDAFYQYLQKLDNLARLQIVSLYIEEKPDPGANVLHVVGRTRNLPHEYFYRRYARSAWTPWEPITTEIEGDHLVTVVWRERLHLFWVTFMDRPRQGTNNSTFVRDVANQTVSEGVPREVQFQLNWSEYFQGQWTPRQSSGFSEPIALAPATSFDAQRIFIHVSKEREAGNESALLVHLTSTDVRVTYTNFFPSGPFLPLAVSFTVSLLRAFRIVSKHSTPSFTAGQRATIPYMRTSPSVTQFAGRNRLSVHFETGGEREVDILREGRDYGLVVNNEPLRYPTPEIGALISPFFYRDNQHTFFVEPTLTETTIPQWEGFSVSASAARQSMLDDRTRGSITIVPQGVWKIPIPVGDPDPLALYTYVDRQDWATDPTATFEYSGRLIGPVGGIAPVFILRSTEFNQR